MPVLVERRRADDGPPFFASERRAGTAAFLDIALVNNMPDSALESTERQFVEVLAAASSDLHVRLTLCSLPEVPRAGAGRDYVRGSYLDVAALRANPPDGLIVTGTEPRTPSLRDEPYWTSLTRLIDWAEDNAIPSVWSCLAAHAAVLHIDGIERVPLEDKRFGLFECVRAADHPLARDLPRHTQVAHSRWNELPLDALAAHGYIILTRSSEGGVDAFVKERKSLALFFQGHPEYDARALLREYRPTSAAICARNARATRACRGAISMRWRQRSLRHFACARWRAGART
jgi:homoserine O-succinyltransferase